MRKVNYYAEILKELAQLKKDCPDFELGRHISMATEEYKDIWGVSDKEMLHLIQKYRLTLESDMMFEDSDIDKIIQDGLDLDHILDEEDDDEDLDW